MPTPANIAKAEAFSFFVRNITGTDPKLVISTEPDIVRVELTEQQKQIMIRWLDKQVINAFTGQEPGELDIDFGGVLVPWALRYLIPATALIFFGGYLSKGIKGKGFKI